MTVLYTVGIHSRMAEPDLSINFDGRMEYSD
jgi:hypothetical protein